MISIQVQPIPHPKTSRNLRVGVMRADGVKSQKDEDERVGKIGELKFAISKCQHGHADEDQKIFEQPIAAIEGMDRQCDPERNVTDNRDGQKMLPGIACVRMSECVSLCVLLSPTHSCASLPLARASLPAGETGTEWKRGRASVRCSNATTPTISNEPTSAETISFWASHSSPCPPSHSTLFPGATISATMLSMTSKQPLTARMIATGNAKLHAPPNSAKS